MRIDCPQDWLLCQYPAWMGTAQRNRCRPTTGFDYRCPYCNLQLRSYQALLPELASFGASMLAISPQLPDASLSTAEREALTFNVLSDLGNDVARQFGLVYPLPQELRDALSSSNKALPSINGDASWELPVPATYVITPNQRISLAFIEVDYRQRLAPQRLLAALQEQAVT